MKNRDRLPNQQKIKESIERVKVECQYDPLNNFNYFAKSGDLAHKFKRGTIGNFVTPK